MDEWTNIKGLSPKANALFSQSWAMVKYLDDHPGLDWGIVEDVLADLFRVECSIMDLREQNGFE